MAKSFKTISPCQKGQADSYNLTPNETSPSSSQSLIAVSDTQPFTSTISSDSGSYPSTSDLDIESGCKQNQISKASRLTSWRCTHWKPSRKHVFILLSINMVFMIGVLYVTSLLPLHIQHELIVSSEYGSPS